MLRPYLKNRMQRQRQSLIPLSRLVLTLGLCTVANLISASFTQAKAPTQSASPLSSTPPDSGITCQASFDACPSHTTHNSQLTTQNLPNNPTPQNPSDRFPIPEIEEHFDVKFSTQADDLLPSYEDLSPTYDRIRIRVFRLAQETDAESAPAPSNSDQAGGDPSLETGERGKLKIPLGGEGDFVFGFGSLIQEPTALEGPTRDFPVPAQANQLALISVVGHVRQRLTENQFLLLELKGDPQQLGFDLSYTHDSPALPGEFSVNFFNLRAFNPAFENGEIEVDLPDGEDPWVHRIGGGIEYETPLTPGLDIAAALNYQKISVRDASFSVQFGVDQSIPVGDADILFHRLVGNVTQYIPLRLFTGEPGAICKAG